MDKAIYSVITGTGCYIPTREIPNQFFLNHEFFDASGKKLTKNNEEIIHQFFDITTIERRRYATDDLQASDLAFFAAREAVKNAGIDVETLDYVIVAHNFGDTRCNNNRSDIVPSLASRVKHLLQIENPNTVAYDILFGCPGWLQAVIQANYYIKSGDAKRVLVIGTDVLSRVSDPHDRDSMLYADGAGAVVLEGKYSETPIGILAHQTRSDTLTHSNMLLMDKSYNADYRSQDELFLKMTGRKLYQYAIETVPLAIKACLDKSGIAIDNIKKVLIHQANGKMDDVILKKFYALYGIENPPELIMPMTISWLGNSSVATLPTLFDLIVKGKLENQSIGSGDTVVFASGGAGMNINAFVYKAV